MYLKSAFLVSHTVFKFLQWSLVSIAFFSPIGMSGFLQILISYSPDTKEFVFAFLLVTQGHFHPETS